MAAGSEDVEIICPKVENLTQIETNIICPVEGCTKVLCNSSALRMHLVKTHKTMEKDCDNVFERSAVNCQNKVKKKTVYCCPVVNCIRSKDSKRYFNRLAHVKQHYMNVHGEKKFICKKCQKTFGRNDVCLRHEKLCGMIFPCSCGQEFNNRTSMLTHARRSGHTALSFLVNKRNRKSSGGVGKQCVPDYGRGVSSGAVIRPLKPKTIISDTQTQTGQAFLVHNKGFSLASNKDVCGNEGLLTCNKAVLTAPTAFPLRQDCLVNERILKDKVCSSNDDLSLVQADEHSSTNEGFLMPEDKDVDMPVDRPDTGMLCKHTQIGFHESFDVDFAIDNENLKELAHSQTQTTWDLTFGNFPLFEDNETQTLESYLELDASTIDCATQTILDEIFSVDNETQTRIPSMQFETNFENLHYDNSMDGQTQTQSWTDFTTSDIENDKITIT